MMIQISLIVFASIVFYHLEQIIDLELELSNARNIEDSEKQGDSSVPSSPAQDASLKRELNKVKGGCGVCVVVLCGYI